MRAFMRLIADDYPDYEKPRTPEPATVVPPWESTGPPAKYPRHLSNKQMIKVLGETAKFKIPTPAHLKRFGINGEQYAAMYKAQGGACAICLRPEDPYGKKLAIDHCHTRGHVRGLLCSACNTTLGHMKDSVELLRAAIAYLEGDNNRAIVKAVSHIREAVLA